MQTTNQFRGLAKGDFKLICASCVLIRMQCFKVGVRMGVKVLLAMMCLGIVFKAFSEEFNPIEIPSMRLHLSKQYAIHHAEIYAKDMFPFLEKNFKLATLPADKFNLKMRSADIKLIFARYGYTITSNESDVVEFVFESDMNERESKEFLQKMYVKHHGENLQIQKILIRPLGLLPEHYQAIEYDLPSNALKRSKGTLTMKYCTLQNPQIKKVPLIYEIQAQFRVLKSTRVIHTNEVIDQNNTALDSVVFDRVWAEYMSLDDLGKNGAKSYIRADLPITKDKLKPRIVVKKGENIRVSTQEGGVMLEAVLIAKQNGVYDEVINALNPHSGKILRVRVVDAGKGEIL